MFTKAIHSTTLTGDAADRLFSNITASGAPDSSFLATMRALLHKRTDGSPARLVCKGLHYTEADIISASVTRSLGWFVPDAVRYPNPSEHTIIIVYTVSPDAGAKILDIVRTNAGGNKKHLTGYALCEDLRIFYARKLNALFYHSEADRNTVIFTDRLELKHFHALQTMLPKYLPALFKAPLTERETALLKSLGDKSAAEYERLIEEFAKDLDIRSEIIRSKLAGFETAFERIRLDEIKVEIKRDEQDYENHLSTLRSLSVRIQERKYILAGLECAIVEHDGDSELMEYFMCNKNLSIIDVSGTTIEFVVHGYADVFDIDAFEQYVGNHNGYMYSRLNPAITKPQMEELYRAIFGGGYKLRMCAAYTANMKTGLKAISNYLFLPESKDYFPNPHIQNHGCIGTYSARFQEYMKKRDYVGGIDQAVVSARNLNFYDSTVMSGFASDLSYYTIKCIEKPDGTAVSPLEAIAELEGICQDQS